MVQGIRYKILLFGLLIVMVTSLLPENIYLLSCFSAIAFFLIPFNKYWDRNCIALIFFSVFYVIVECLKQEVGSGFALVVKLISPIAFYRLGMCMMANLPDDKSKVKFLFFVIFCYLFHLFILTIKDIAIIGIINDSRILLGDSGKENTLAATLYGLMASAGIGCCGVLFSKDIKILYKIGLALISFMSTIVVVHLINRTGLVILCVCILLSYSLYTKMKLNKILLGFLMIVILIIVVMQTGILNQDIVDAYANRNTGTSSSGEFGGRSALWTDALSKVITHPFGWEREHYAHNLWLDMARVGGWFSLIPFIIVTFSAITNCIVLIRKKNKSTVDVLIISIFAAMLLNSFVEPVIDASLLFFSLQLLIWGMLKAKKSDC